MNFNIKHNLGKLVLILLFISGCNTGSNSNFTILPTSMQLTESRICDLYFKYLENISSPDFPLYPFKVNADLNLDTELKQKISINPDFIFFPATLWQMYILKKKSSWKDGANYYTKAIQAADSAHHLLNGELIQSVFLTADEINNNKNYGATIIEAISKYISKLERKNSLAENKVAARESNLNLLLENKVLFFATKETGDPVYRNFAIENSSYLYEKCFQNNLQIRSALKNDNTGANIQLLTTDDFYTLAVGLCGFSVLYKETEMEDYLAISEKIAFLFKRVFNAEDKTIEEEIQQELIRKIDLVSQSLVSLALLDLCEHLDDSYIETSSKIYHHILAELELNNDKHQVKHKEGSNSNASFRLFSYLIEYEIRKQNEF